MRLYQRIDGLINNSFDTLDADKLSVLTRTMKDLEDSIQLYKKGLQNGELYGVTYRSIRKDKKLEGFSLMEIYRSI
jgi:type III secretory pathway lipoprotein EscJ